MFRFANLEIYLYFLYIFVALVGLFLLRTYISKYVLKKNYSLRLLKYYWQKIRLSSFGLKRFCFFILGSLFALLSLWRPQFGQKKIPLSTEGIEIVFALDISRSMATRDVKPERLRLAKIQLTDLISKYSHNKMGLIAFAGQVGVISPLTQDVGALSLFLNSLDFKTISEQGTNTNLALKEAKALLRRGGDKNGRSSQVVVLVTDGEDHSQNTLATVKDLYSSGIRTFVVGVGSKQGGKIPVRDDFNQVVGYLRNSQGDVVVSKPNFKFLKALAKAGHGGFYTLGFGNRMYKAMSNDFSKIKKTKFETQSFDVQNEYYQYLLLIAVFFYTLSLMSTRTGRQRPVRSLKYLEDHS